MYPTIYNHLVFYAKRKTKQLKHICIAELNIYDKLVGPTVCTCSSSQYTHRSGWDIIHC